MDEYQICTLDDAPMLADKLEAGENVLFSYSADRANAYVIFIAAGFSQVGTLPFGGSPIGRYFVGLLGRGVFHFDFKKKIHANYVEEKLGISEYAAEDIACMLNAIGEELYPKQTKTGGS